MLRAVMMFLILSNVVNRDVFFPIVLFHVNQLEILARWSME